MQQSIFFAVLLLAGALAGCGGDQETADGGDQVTADGGAATEVDHRSPDAVAIAWVRAWCEGKGGHLEFQFEPVPSEARKLPGKDAPRGRPPRRVEAKLVGVGGAPTASTGFSWGADAGIRGPAGGRARYLRYAITARFENGESFETNLFVAPEGSNERYVQAGPQTRWRVVSGHP